jgi:WD40 repeat protein
MQRHTTVRGHRLAVYCVAFDRRGGLVITGADDYLVKVSHRRSNCCVVLAQPGDRTAALCMPCSAAVQTMKTVAQRATAAGTKLRARGVQCLGRSIPRPPGAAERTHLASSDARARRAQIWDVRTGLLRASCRGHDQEVTDLAVSGDNRLAASGSLDRSIRVWNLQVRRLVLPSF